MTTHRTRSLLLALALSSTVAAQTPTPAPVERRTAAPDPALSAAESYIGRALFLRCFCADNKLDFDAQGHPLGPIKTVDWTLAAFNLEKVDRKAPGTLELQGVRVAIRYAADRHEFERHPQKDEKLHITLTDTGDAKSTDRTLAAIFAIGIDRPLQLSMPDFWRHYFDPRLDWPPDALTPQSIYAGTGPELTSPKVAHRADPSYTSTAQKDRIRGIVQMRVVIDPQGLARRVAIAQPLGYGLDEKAVEAVAKFRFTPATKADTPVPVMVLLDEEFAPIVAPH